MLIENLKIYLRYNSLIVFWFKWRLVYENCINDYNIDIINSIYKLDTKKNKKKKCTGFATKGK